jgi:hypothetical protein
MGEAIALAERSAFLRLANFRNRWAAHIDAAESSTIAIKSMRWVMA